MPNCTTERPLPLSTRGKYLGRRWRGGARREMDGFGGGRLWTGLATAPEWRWWRHGLCEASEDARAESGLRPRLLSPRAASALAWSATRSTCGHAGRRRTRWPRGYTHGRPTRALGASRSAPRMGRGSWRSRRGRPPAPDASSWDCTGCAAPRRRGVSSQQAPRLLGRGQTRAGTLLLPKCTAARCVGAHISSQGTGCAASDVVQLNYRWRVHSARAAERQGRGPSELATNRAPDLGCQHSALRGSQHTTERLTSTQG